MATDLQAIQNHLDTMRSLPPRLEGLERSLGTTRWPGQPARMDLPSGVMLTEQDRTEIASLLKSLDGIVTGSNLTKTESSKARLSLVTKLLLGHPSTGGNSEAAAEARQSMYEDAIEDVAPWAIAAAIKRWSKRQVPTSVRAPNFSFAPAPADLRAICDDELQPFKAQIYKLKRLQQAVSLERAMDPTPLPQPERRSGEIVAMSKRM